MPNRILREGILTSEAVDMLDEGAEVFYRRLMSVVDDYGRFHGNPELLRSYLYPLRVDKIKISEIKRHIQKCSDAKLLNFYLIENKPFVQLENFKQQIRTNKSKFPPPIANEINREQLLANDINREQMISSASKCSPYSYAYSETEAISIDTNVSHPLSGDLEVFDFLKKTISKMYNRRESTPWNEKESKKLKEIAKRPEARAECMEIHALYESGTYQYFRRDIYTLLNNWTGELDRARLQQGGKEVANA